MYCPNCGKNCDNVDVCPACGTPLHREEKWKEGTPCPYCGGMGLEDGCCVYCGVRLVNENEKEQPLWQTDSFEIPYGNFKSFMGHITLERNGLRIWNKGAILSKEITIAYDQLTYLKYVRPQKNIFSDGFLILRWEGNKSKPVPKGYALRNDKTAIHFDYMHHLIFYHLYCVLRTLAPEMIVTEMEIPETLSLNVEAQAKSKYVEDCFNRFSPDRYQATIAYCEHMGINHKTSEMIINRAFDIRQEQIYAASPSTAIRDLNRVLMKDASASYVYG